MSYEETLYENELKYIKMNSVIIQKFVNDFFLRTKLDINEFKLLYDELDGYLKLFLSLKEYVFNKCPSYISIFYGLLKIYDYQMGYDVFDCMFLLGQSKNNREIVLLSPNIISVLNNQDKMIIMSERFGNYTFYNLEEYFNDSSDIMFYLNENKETLCKNCHNSSWRFVNIFKDTNLITLLTPSYFVGTMYHSVVRDRNGMIIDLANGIVYDDSVINKLLQGRIICETKYDELSDSFYEAITDSNYQGMRYSKPLLLALHKQAKERKEI